MVGVATVGKDAMTMPIEFSMCEGYYAEGIIKFKQGGKVIDYKFRAFFVFDKDHPNGFVEFLLSENEFPHKLL